MNTSGCSTSSTIEAGRAPRILTALMPSTLAAASAPDRTVADSAAARAALGAAGGGSGEPQQGDPGADRRDVDRGQAIGLPVDRPFPDDLALERGQPAEQKLGAAERDQPARHPPRRAGVGDLPLADEGVALVPHLEQREQPALFRASAARDPDRRSHRSAAAANRPASVRQASAVVSES